MGRGGSRKKEERTEWRGERIKKLILVLQSGRIFETCTLLMSFVRFYVMCILGDKLRLNTESLLLLNIDGLFE